MYRIFSNTVCIIPYIDLHSKLSLHTFSNWYWKMIFVQSKHLIFFLIYSLIKLYSMFLTPSEHEKLSFVFLWIFFVCLNPIAMKIIIFQNSLKTYKNMTWIFCKLIWPNKTMCAAFMIWLGKKLNLIPKEFYSFFLFLRC